MKIHRFIKKDIDLSATQIRDKTLVQQMTRVLKLRRGEQIILCNGINEEILARIQDFTDDTLVYEIIELHANIENLERKIILACAVLKKENFEMVVQKATELSVHEIVPFISARTIKTGLRYDRLELIACEAAEQSGRGIVPLIHEISELNAIPSLFADFEHKYICHTSGTDISPESGSAGNSVIVVGPEGGFEEGEVVTMSAVGFRPISLGQFTLRAETAAIAGLVILTKN